MGRRHAHRWTAAAGLATLLAASVTGAAARDGSTTAIVAGTPHMALFSISMDGVEGLAVGAGGAMLATSDEGVTWQTAAGRPTEQALLGAALRGDRAIVVGQAGLILVREGDGGWQAASSGTAERLLGVDFNAAGLAVAVGSFGTILRSTDGGLTWTPVAPAWAEGGYTEQGLEPHLYAVHVADDGTVTCVGEFGLVLRSTDGGSQWSAVHGGESSLFALDLRADGVGYAVGQGGTILRTSDGGNTWAPVPSGSDANLLGVSSSADGRVVVTAMRDMLASDDGLAWQRLDAGDFGSAWYADVVVTGSGADAAALVVGHSGRIVRIER